MHGISGVVATYDYIYYTMPSQNAIYKVDFDCADLKDCNPERTLIGVCDRPVHLNYSPITKLVYVLIEIMTILMVYCSNSRLILLSI